MREIQTSGQEKYKQLDERNTNESARLILAETSILDIEERENSVCKT